MGADSGRYRDHCHKKDVQQWYVRVIQMCCSHSLNTQVIAVHNRMMRTITEESEGKKLYDEQCGEGQCQIDP